MFRNDINNITIKESRASLCKYFKTVLEGKSGAGQVLMQVGQALAQYLYKVDQIASEDSPSKKRMYYKKRMREMELLKLEGEMKAEEYNGVQFWKEEYIYGVLGLFCSMGRSLEEKVERGRLEEDFKVLRVQMVKYMG
jgi:hypothetical protein